MASRRPRVTGGRLRGRALVSPVPDSARPTSARVREAMFSMVGHELDGKRVLDAYGGSGLLGIEAWSRGAHVVIVERDRLAARAIRANLAGLQADVTLHFGDVGAIGTSLGQFEGVFVDAPYSLCASDALGPVKNVADEWLLYEADAGTLAPPIAGRLSLDRSRSYGGTTLHLYMRAH